MTPPDPSPTSCPSFRHCLRPVDCSSIVAPKITHNNPGEQDNPPLAWPAMLGLVPPRMCVRIQKQKTKSNFIIYAFCIFQKHHLQWCFVDRNSPISSMWCSHKINIWDEPRIQWDEHSLGEARFSREIRFSFGHLGRAQPCRSAQLSAAATAIPLGKCSNLNMSSLEHAGLDHSPLKSVGILPLTTNKSMPQRDCIPLPDCGCWACWIILALLLLSEDPSIVLWIIFIMILHIEKKDKNL